MLLGYLFKNQEGNKKLNVQRMKKILIIILSLFLFILSYQVRTGFINTRNYNEPSDAGEYANSAHGLRLYIKNIFSSGQPLYGFSEHVIGTFNVHGVPLYNTYTTLLSLFSLQPQMIAPTSNSIFVVFLFLVSLFFLPLGISLILGLIASLYTPLFSSIYSWMPENFTAIVIPAMVISASILAVNAKSLGRFLLIGFILFLIGLSRNVFMFYGVLFISIYLLIFRNIRKRNIIGLILAYVLPTFIWLIIVKWSGTSAYAPGNFQIGVFYANHIKTDGWALDGFMLSWMEVIKNTLLQNPISLILLRLERITRFFKNPADAYTVSFPFSENGLLFFHVVILFFAAWGVRTIFRNKSLLLIFSAIVWNVFFITSYYLEETRLQAPTIALVLLFAGVGIGEYLRLIHIKSIRNLVIITSSVALIWFYLRSNFLGIELALFPFIENIELWRVINITSVTFLMIYVSRQLWRHDSKIFLKHLWLRRLYSFLPFFIFFLVLVPHLRSRTWHQWNSYLSFGQYIEQKIDLSKDQVETLRQVKGYLLVDIQDGNSGYSLSVALNNIPVKERLPMNKMRSPVDLLALRQWQKELPRLGWGHVENEVATVAAWPDMHQWLVFPIDGNVLKENNKIVVKNTSLLSSARPLIFGDYLPSGLEKYYEGPNARLFQGPSHFNKYQITGDFRLDEKKRLLSIDNKSSFYLASGEKLKNDLSLNLGKQVGRYRIFFLFPYDTGDPESIF